MPVVIGRARSPFSSACVMEELTGGALGSEGLPSLGIFECVQIHATKANMTEVAA